ncbi:MAG: D-aminoacyl-tRNA deacylase [Clostridiales bacterium]|jgi:D-tyrosyl-tRNA(Tyr) deacylase|nr:D-aminoacyl-tRNA deacylase [Clostridiales bacterium]MCK9350778.1 D-aminoacyl-tRNA deacylase [Clostridiales bacterium]MDD2572325.1 D-aminoacyl-tRNA deacylase [Eubacteriales bacterium]MDD4186840.1 D-aminoacyl-tRNA deacylase [Eubacteriales bacterium]
MRALIQRVTQAKVSTRDGFQSEIEKGYLILLGVGEEDDESSAARLWNKINKLRIFKDEAGKTNLDLASVDGEVLIVSQFTLFANTKKGNRPSFIGAASPEKGERLYEYFVELARRDVEVVQTGSFGAEMKINLVNDGPFTLWLDTDQF